MTEPPGGVLPVHFPSHDVTSESQRLGASVNGHQLHKGRGGNGRNALGFRKAGAWLGLVEHHDDDGQPLADDLPDEEYADQDVLASEEIPIGQRAVDEGFQVASVQPQNFLDAHTIGEYFRQDIPVIINLHDMDAPDAKRIVDFASGLTFGRRGDVERLSSRVFLLMPPHSSILREQGTMTSKEFFNQT
jgi:cell division inhibitor SepF